jgi:MoaA/NifB/PqqE/SkfB family radical SAM enzyme
MNDLVIVWRINEHCNLTCPFCEYRRTLARSRSAANPDEVLAFGALLRDYQAQTQRRMLVSWLGGEPTVWPPLMDIAATFKHEYGLRLSLTTNGARLDSDAWLDHIITTYDQLTLSIDGLGARHDEYRLQAGLFERLHCIITQLCRRKTQTGSALLLRVNTILMRDNLTEFPRLCETLAEWGVNEVTFNALGSESCDAFHQQRHLSPSHIAWLQTQLPTLRERMAQHGLRVLGSTTYLDRLKRTAQNLAIPIADCHAGQRFWFIDERGFLAPCSFTTDSYGLALRELQSVNDLQQLPIRFAARKRQTMFAPCHDCMSTQVFGKFELGV